MPHCLASNYHLVYHTVILSFCKDQSQAYLSRRVGSDRWFEWKHSTAGKTVYLFRNSDWYFNTLEGFSVGFSMWNWFLFRRQGDIFLFGFFFFFGVDILGFRIICVNCFAGDIPNEGIWMVQYPYMLWWALCFDKCCLKCNKHLRLSWCF